MSLEDLGNIGEFVAAVAVVISLVYLAIQIRQNTGQIRQNTAAVGNASYHQAIEQSWLVNLKVADDPEVARIMRAGYRDMKELNDDERMQFLVLIQLVAFALESTMRLHERGLVDTEVCRVEELARRIGIDGMGVGPLLTWSHTRSFVLDEAGHGTQASVFLDWVAGDTPAATLHLGCL